MATNEVLTNPVIQVNGAATIEPSVEVATLCEIKECQVVTTSLRVAEIFSKEHRRVLQTIRELDCSPEFHKHNFVQMLKDTKLGNNATRQDPYYFITRDGFVFLVMGFTGKTAAKFKEAYIRAFNEMEAKLRREQEEQRRLKPVQPAHTMAEMPGLVRESLQRTAPIVESYGQQRVVSTVTLARLQNREHDDVCKSVRRMFKYVLRPGRQFIRKTRTVRRGNGTGYEREDGVMFYVTIEGFNTMRKYCTSISDDVAEQVMAAFREAKGKNRPRTGQAPLPKQEAKPQQPMAVTPNLPQTPADMMVRFTKAVAVMLGVDMDELTGMMRKGGAL